MKQMKDSGIEWIGETPEDWEFIKIGSIFRCRNEKVNDTDYPPLSVTRNGIVPQMENIAKTDANDNRKMVKVNDFVINSRSDRKQSCGVSDLDGSVSLINTVLYTENTDVILPEYTNLLMKNYGFAEEFYRWGHGIVADLWTTRWQEMKSIVLPLPNTQQQEEIVRFVQKKVCGIDNLIAHEQATIEELKAYKQSVITEAVTKGLDKSVSMKDSGVEWIGEIPESWSVSKIKTLADETQENAFIDGDWIESPYIQDEGIRYLTTGNVGDGIFKRQGSGFISEETFVKLQCKYVYPNDLIFSRLNEEYGRSCILPYDYDKYIIAVDTYMLAENKIYVDRNGGFVISCEQQLLHTKTEIDSVSLIIRDLLGNYYKIPLKMNKVISNKIEQPIFRQGTIILLNKSIPQIHCIDEMVAKELNNFSLNED